MADRRMLAWIGAVALGAMAALAGPAVVARWNASRTTLGSGWGAARVEAFPAPESCSYLLVVARRPERMALDDPTPHRNSRVALYERGKAGWRRATEPLPIRSKSTVHEPPEWDGMSPESRTYGYASVPLGIFTLAQGPWRDGITPAFRISDWGRFDGLLGLHTPQVLRLVTAAYNGETRKMERTETTVRTALEKSGSWIHPTHTERWSQGDSQGCMNLFRPLEPGGGTPEYDVFLSWFAERGLEPGPEGDLVPLAVVPFDFAHERGTDDGMAMELPGDFLDRVRPLQGRQLEEIP